jgi:hypothetical protein
MKRSAKIVVLDRFVKQRIVAKGIPPAKVHIISPWPLEDIVAYDKKGREEFRRMHGFANKFVVMYAGNHSPCHPLTTLLDAAEKLAHREDIVFCFVGGGSEFAAVKQFASSCGLERVVCLPYQPRSQLAGVLSAADLHAIIIGDPFVGIIHPSKIYNVLKVQAPFLYVGPPQSHVADIVESMADTAAVYVAKHGEVDQIVDHIRAAASNHPDGSRARVVEFKSSGSLAEMVNLVEEQSPLQRSPAVEDRSTVTRLSGLISTPDSEP